MSLYHYDLLEELPSAAAAAVPQSLTGWFEQPKLLKGKAATDLAQGPFAGNSPALSGTFATSAFFDAVKLKQPIPFGEIRLPGTSPALNSPYVQAPLWEPTRLKQPIINVPDNVPAITAAIPIRENWFEPVKLKQPIINTPDKFQGTSPALNNNFVQAALWEATRLKQPKIDTPDLPPKMAQVIVNQSQFPLFDAVRLKQPIINTAENVPPFPPNPYVQAAFFEPIRLKQPLISVADLPPNMPAVIVNQSQFAFFDAVRLKQPIINTADNVPPFPPAVSTIQNGLVNWFDQIRLKQPINTFDQPPGVLNTVIPPPDTGTVLSDRKAGWDGHSGYHFSRKRWEELLAEVQAERKAEEKAKTAKAKAAAREAERLAEEARQEQLVQEHNARELAELVAGAQRATKTADAIRQIREIKAWIDRRREEDDDDDVMLMLGFL